MKATEAAKGVAAKGLAAVAAKGLAAKGAPPVLERLPAPQVPKMLADHLAAILNAANVKECRRNYL